MDHQPIISLQQALDIAQQKALKLPTEFIDFKDAAGRVLAQAVYSDISMPPFDKSAMDGYACKRRDLGKALTILEVIPAGQAPSYAIQEGQCSKIMTGAQVPAGANTVFMIEQSELVGSNQVRFTGSKTSSNICLSGEDVKNGDLVLEEGTLLKAQHIALLAAVGCTSPKVYALPRIGIISTGSELVEPEVIPQGSQIRNSNGHQLGAQALQTGSIINYYGVVRDEKEATFQLIQKATEENDITLISGGVSVGDFDFVPAIIQKLGFEIHFNKLTVKPGKHTTFASKSDRYIIGLPGNPVSSFIQFEVFVKPFIFHLMNYQLADLSFPLPLAQPFKRRKADREEFIPVHINAQKEVETISYHGSAHIHAYHQAMGFMHIPQGTDQLNQGEIVYVRPL